MNRIYKVTSTICLAISIAQSAHAINLNLKAILGGGAKAKPVAHAPRTEVRQQKEINGKVEYYVGEVKHEIRLQDISDSYRTAVETATNQSQKQALSENQATLDALLSHKSLKIENGILRLSSEKDIFGAFLKQLFSLKKESVLEMNAKDIVSHMIVIKETIRELESNPQFTADQAYYRAIENLYGKDNAKIKIEELLACK